MLLLEVYAWATGGHANGDLKNQLAAGIAVAAVNVLAESTDAHNHANRVLWAKRVLNSPQSPLDMANQMIWGVLGNTTIQGELAAEGSVVPDGDLFFVIASLVDTYAP